MIIDDFIFGKIFILLSLAIFSCQDIKHKGISLHLCVFLYPLELSVYLFFLGGAYSIDFISIAVGMLSGAFCLFISKISEQKLGYGDGLIFAFIGSCVHWNKYLAFITLLILFVGLVSLLIVFINILRLKYRRDSNLPLIPFMLITLIVVEFFGKGF